MFPFFQDFEKVKEKLCFRLVNREEPEQLEKVPYIPILDLGNLLLLCV